MAASVDTTLGNCSVHTAKAASFRCEMCKQPCCQDCIGRQEAGKIICSHCMIDINKQEKEALQQAVEADIREKHAAITEPPAVEKKSGNGLFYAFIVAALLGIGFNLFIIYQDRVQSSGAEAARTPAMSPQLAGIRVCRHRITLLSQTALLYQQDLGAAPDGLEDLAPRLESRDALRDPVTGLAYRFVKGADGGIVIACPSPASHGVHSIQAHIGKAARVEYQERKR